MPALAKLLDRIVDRIERMDRLDTTSDAVAKVARSVIRPGRAEDTLGGVDLGHPLHPLLVAVPIGAWTAAFVLDASGDAEAARRLVGWGALAAVPTAMTGTSDWLTTSGAERRVGLVHALLNDGAVLAQVASWYARRKGNRGSGILLSTAAMGLLAAAGWLGGHLAYALGVGVDTTAFQQLPDQWTDAVALDDVTDALVPAEVNGVPIVVFRSGEELVALSGRCTHRGGPLHEGSLEHGCLTCPWHGSTFAADGSVLHGPATRPEPRLEVRVVEGRVQVRRDEPRALRTNPVGR